MLGHHIQAQAEKVIAQNEKLENDLGALVQERNELKAQLHNQQEEIMTLKAEIQRLRLAESLSGNSADNSKSRARINLLLREVDKCIDLLTKTE